MIKIVHLETHVRQAFYCPSNPMKTRNFRPGSGWGEDLTADVFESAGRTPLHIVGSFCPSMLARTLAKQIRRLIPNFSAAPAELD